MVAVECDKEAEVSAVEEGKREGRGRLTIR
jgi:hypothetical protein